MKRTDKNTTLQDLKDEVAQFIDERDWRQFHNDPKNTLLSMVIEIGELLEHFRFTTSDEARSRIKSKNVEIADELADVFYHILMFSAENNIDLSDAFSRKMEQNRKKYSDKKFSGKNLKYDEL